MSRCFHTVIIRRVNLEDPTADEDSVILEDPRWQGRQWRQRSSGRLIHPRTGFEVDSSGGS